MTNAELESCLTMLEAARARNEQVIGQLPAQYALGELADRLIDAGDAAALRLVLLRALWLDQSLAVMTIRELIERELVRALQKKALNVAWKVLKRDKDATLRDLLNAATWPRLKEISGFGPACELALRKWLDDYGLCLRADPYKQRCQWCGSGKMVTTEGGSL